MQEMKDLHHEGRTLTYPRFQAGPPCTAGELARLAARNTAFTEAEVKGILALVAGAMADVMAEGRSVRVDGIGTFRPRLGLVKQAERETTEKDSERRNARSIQVNGINFKPEAELVGRTHEACHLERMSKTGRLHPSPFTAEERLQQAQDYLETNPFLTGSDYAMLTGLNRSSASAELRKWAAMADSGIGTAGCGTHKVYIKK